MTNEEIEKKIAKLDALAEKNYRNYHDSGESRYYRTYEKYEEEADLYRRILVTNDEHNHYITIKNAVANAVSAYERSLHKNPSDAYETMRKALNELKIMASVIGVR